MKAIPHSKPTTGAEEATAVGRVLASGHHARGPECLTFERGLGDCVGMAHVHATSSGTTALQLGLLALGAGPGKTVVMPSLTCAAVWNAVRATGAAARLYDCDYALPVGEEIARLIDQDVCAVIVVAPMDQAADIEKIKGVEALEPGIAGFHGVPILLDRCQQLSSDKIGTLRPSIEVFSFYATKCISTGSGGAIATPIEALHRRVVDLNSHDKREEYSKPRYNFQYDDVRAAVGNCQLSRLEDFVVRRREHALAYAKGLGGERVFSEGMVFRYLHDCTTERAAVEKRCAAAGIETKQPVFRPLHRYMDMPDGDFPKAVEAWDRMLSLPLYPSLTPEERDRVIRVVAG